MCPVVTTQPQSRYRPHAGPPTLWLCLRFDALALEALREADHALDFVYQQHRVIAISQQAQAQGLQCGMSVNQALLVAPELRGLERDERREQQQLQVLAHWAYRYTSQVSLGQQSVLLEVGHSLKLFKGFRPLFRRIESDLTAFAISARPAVAHTPAAAYVLSYALNNGVVAAENNAVEADVFLLLLGQAAIETLAVDERIISQLQACGFETLEDLLTAPREDIGQRFGRPFIDYLARLLGEKDDPQPLIVPPEPFLLTQDFAEPVHNSQWIEKSTDDMLQQFCQFLQRRQWLCQLLEWRFYSDKKLIEQLSIALSSKHYGFTTLKRLTDLHLEKLKLGGELMRIELFSDTLLPAQLWVDDFFDPRIKEQEASELVDKLATRLGSDSVYQLGCVAEPVPEYATVQLPFDACVAPRRILSQCETGSVSARREFQPSWLLAQPQPLLTLTQDPALPRDNRGRPMALIQGPERMESHWWRSAAEALTDEVSAGFIARDYYIARQHNGRLLWVFFDRQLKQWFLQGLFG